MHEIGNPSRSGENPAEGIFYLLKMGRGIGNQVRIGAAESIRRRNSPHMLLHPNSERIHHLCDPEILGAFLCGHGREILELLLDRNYPVINHSSSMGVVPGMGNLLSDDRAVGRMAAEHLLRRGHRSFLVLWYEGRNPHSDRAEGFMEVVRAQGCSVVAFPNAFAGDYDLHRTHLGYLQGMRALIAGALEKIPLGSGIFASNDDLALMVQQVMALAYPEHLATSGVLGVDNSAEDFGYMGRLPELSSVVPGFRQMGAEAMDWLLDHPGPSGKAEVGQLYRRYPPVGVVARASTAAGACADPVVARMIRWIWSHVQQGRLITATELARAHNMSRKTMERRFAQHAGSTPGELILKLRLDLARDLLRNTSLSIAEISHRCGFAKQDVLSRALRAAEGCTPREYRGRVTSGE